MSIGLEHEENNMQDKVTETLAKRRHQIKAKIKHQIKARIRIQLII